MKNRLLELIQAKQDKERRIITASQIARESRVHRFTINNWLSGEIKRIDQDTAEKLCRYFECDLSDLVYFDWEGNPPKGVKESA